MMKTQVKNRGARLIIALLAAMLLLPGCSYMPQEVEVIGPEDDSSRLSTETYVPVYEEHSPEEEARRRREAAAEEAAAAHAQAEEEEEIDPNRRTMADTMNLRDGPGMDSTVIGLIPAGAYVYLTGEEENGWCPVQYGDLEGYVKSGFFVEDRPEEPEEEEEEIEEPEVKEGRILEDEDPGEGPDSEQEGVPDIQPGDAPEGGAEGPMEEQITDLPPEITE